MQVQLRSLRTRTPGGGGPLHPHPHPHPQEEALPTGKEEPLRNLRSSSSTHADPEPSSPFESLGSACALGSRPRDKRCSARPSLDDPASPLPALARPPPAAPCSSGPSPRAREESTKAGGGGGQRRQQEREKEEVVEQEEEGLGRSGCQQPATDHPCPRPGRRNKDPRPCRLPSTVGDERASEPRPQLHYLVARG